MGADSGDGSTTLSSCSGTTTAKSSSNMPTHRHQPASSSSRTTSAAGASAAVSIAMPSARSGHKGSTGGAAGWTGVLGFGGRQHAGFKGHHGHQYGFLAGSRRQLTCLAVLLMLPMGFLVTTHLLSHYSSSSSFHSSSRSGSANWIARQTILAGSSDIDSDSSTSGSEVNGGSNTVGASRKTINLDNLDLSKWQPLPKNYAAAKAIVTAAKLDSESSSSSTSSSSSSSTGGSNGEFHCIPPSRTLSWDQVDAEISQKITAAAAGAASGQAEDEDEDEQQQQQQAVDEVAGYHRRLQQQQQKAAPLPAAGAATVDNDVESLYYDLEAAAAPAVSNDVAAGVVEALDMLQSAAATTTEGNSSSQHYAATAGESNAWEVYYDPEAAVDGELPAAEAAGESAVTFVAAAAHTVGAGGADALTKPGVAGSQPTSSSGTEQQQQAPSSQQIGDAGAKSDSTFAVASASVASTTAGSTSAGSTTSGGSTASDSSNSNRDSTAKPAPPVDVSAVVSHLSIALINDVEFHHEVTLGLMAALQKHKDRLTVYLHDSMFKSMDSTTSNSFDFVPYVNSVMPGNKLVNAYYKEGITKTDVAIFVSPEFSIKYYREFIRRATPRMLIIFIHEPNMQLSRLQYIINMHPLVGVATLSPHVAETVRTRMHMNFVHWMMPVLPVPCSNTCWEGFAVQGKFEGSRRNYASLWEAMSKQLAESKSLVNGPARQLQADGQQLLTRHLQSRNAQGSHAGQVSHVGFDCERGLKLLSGETAAAKWQNRAMRRRNLHSSSHHGINTKHLLQLFETWLTGGASTRSTDSSIRGLQEVAAGGPGGPGGPGAILPRINLLGSGALTQLAVPNELRPYVFLYRNLRYNEYFDTLCRSTALLPLFNSSGGYLRDKISSTVLASVATGVPMIVPQKFLEVYQVFKAEHVIVMDEATSASKSPELAVMMGLSAPTAQATTLAPRRKALEHLRYILNAQATAKLEGLMSAAHGRPHATTKQE